MIMSRRRTRPMSPLDAPSLILLGSGSTRRARPAGTRPVVLAVPAALAVVVLILAPLVAYWVVW